MSPGNTTKPSKDYSRGADMQHCIIAGVRIGRVFKQPFVYCALFCSCARIVLPDEGIWIETSQKKKDCRVK